MSSRFVLFMFFILSLVNSQGQISYGNHPGYQAIDIDWRSNDEGFIFCHGALNIVGQWHVSNSWLLITLDDEGAETDSESFITSNARFFDCFYDEEKINVLLRDTASGEMMLHEFDENLNLTTYIEPLEENMVLLTSESYEGGIATLQVPNGLYWNYPDSILLRNYGSELELQNEVILSDPDFVPQQISFLGDRWIVTGITSIEQGSALEYLRCFEVDLVGEMNLLFQTNTVDYFWSFEQEIRGDDLWIHANDVGYWPSFMVDHELHHIDLVTEEHTVIEGMSSDTAWFMPGAIHPDGSYWMPATLPAFFNFDTWGSMWHITSDGSAVEVDNWQGDYERSTLFKAASKDQTMTACGMIRGPDGITFPAIWMYGAVGVVERNTSAEVFPNPSSDFIRISSSEKILSYEIMALSGEVVSSGDHERIDVGALSSGIYLIRYATNSGMGVAKFVKISP